MTTDELKAAAERLISCNGELEWKEQYEGNGNHDFNDDVDDVAKYVISRLAADEHQAKDDAEPIDFGDRVERGCTKDIFISLWKESKVVAIVQHEETVDGPEVSCVTTKIKTRGQLRKLLEALKGGE